MSLRNTIAAALVALGLAGAAEGCGSISLPRYELRAIETQKASAEEIVKSNYKKALGKEAPAKSPAELVAEMQKEFEASATEARAATDTLNLRDALQRAARAAQVELNVTAQNATVVAAITEEFKNVAIKDADLGQVLALASSYSAAAPDLVTANASTDFKSATVMTGNKIYSLSAEAEKLTAPFTVTTSALAEPNFDMVKTHRVVTEGTDTGKLVTPTSAAVSYVIGTDSMSKALVKALKEEGISLGLDDTAEFFTSKYVRDKGPFGADNPEGKSANFAAVNGRVHALKGNAERKAFYSAQEELALEEAKKGNFHRVRALSSAMLDDKSYFTAEQYDAFAGKALAWLDTEEGGKVKVDLGAIAMKPTGNGAYEQVSGGLRRDSLDKKPYFVLVAPVKGGHLPIRVAVELLSEMTPNKGYVGDAVELEAKTTELGDILTLLREGHVRSEITGEVLRERKEMSTTLSEADMKVYGGTFTVYGRARRE